MLGSARAILKPSKLALTPPVQASHSQSPSASYCHGVATRHHHDLRKVLMPSFFILSCKYCRPPSPLACSSSAYPDSSLSLHSICTAVHGKLLRCQREQGVKANNKVLGYLWTIIQFRATCRGWNSRKLGGCYVLNSRHVVAVKWGVWVYIWTAT